MSATISTPVPIKPSAPERRLNITVSEHCLTLLDRLGLGSRDATRVPRALGVTSCVSGEGVTTIAAELAIGAATRLELRTVLVDCNFDAPAVHRVFGVELGPGLHEALEDPMRLPKCLQSGRTENLTLLTAGMEMGDAKPASHSTGLKKLFDELRSKFELIVVDLPPVSDGSAANIGSRLDGVILVVEAERIRWEVAQHATATLNGGGVNLLGAVMNKRLQHVPPWLYRSL